MNITYSVYRGKQAPLLINQWERDIYGGQKPSEQIKLYNVVPPSYKLVYNPI